MCQMTKYLVLGHTRLCSGLTASSGLGTIMGYPQWYLSYLRQVLILLLLFWGIFYSPAMYLCIYERESSVCPSPLTDFTQHDILQICPQSSKLNDFIFSKGLVIPLCMVQSFLYPIICSWEVRLFSDLDYCEWHCHEHRSTDVFSAFCGGPFGDILWNEITASMET